jgi:hypothetical protein
LGASPGGSPREAGNEAFRPGWRVGAGRPGGRGLQLQRHRRRDRNTLYRVGGPLGLRRVEFKICTLGYADPAKDTFLNQINPVCPSGGGHLHRHRCRMLQAVVLVRRLLSLGWKVRIALRSRDQSRSFSPAMSPRQPRPGQLLRAGRGEDEPEGPGLTTAPAVSVPVVPFVVFLVAFAAGF